ncbi:MAG: sugar ABC transporter substrate-binding protein [Phycisphaerae bacterium]|jgi:ribose transport system substrate-binding protein|nr:sugar ABC transporter substrate-binding protein [Phycisphaerae bacterium]
MTKRFVNCGVVLAVVVLVCGLPSCKKPDESQGDAVGSGKFCVSLGWLENESGQRQKRGFVDAFKIFGGEATYANANYDAKKQSEQIDAFIEMKPKAIFVTPSDPAGITQACQRAVDAGIPIFVADAIVAGVPATTSICSSDFRMGAWTMDYIAKHLKGKGNIAMVTLPENEAWALRGQGAKFAMEKYPDIKMVSEYEHNSQTGISPLTAVERILDKYPKGKLDAIWCAWDGAAQEGAQAIENAGRADEIITTGIDGGKHAFEVIKSDGPFKVTMAQSIYYMSYMSVRYAHEHLKGDKAPRFIISPVFAVDKATLDALDEKFKPEDYDIPGNAVKFGWKPEL